MEAADMHIGDAIVLANPTAELCNAPIVLL